MVTPVFIQALLLPTAYPHPVVNVRLIETHISWVLIAGDFAYKIKKPVNFGFLDFSTLARRKRFCAEEIRLNQRLAPEIYLEVISIHGVPEAAHIGGEGPLLEYAVKMRAFPPEATLDRQACITPAQIDAIATRVARFHCNAEVAPVESDYGTPENVQCPVRDNLSHIRAMALPVATLASLDSLANWSEAEGARLSDHFQARKAAGYVRECHGDLHLGNIAWVDDQPLIFDCLEFDPGLRHIDVISETAFMVMDLLERKQPRLAWRYLNQYLMWTGDYAGLTAWRFYLVYRAMVRAKVDMLRASQNDPAARDEAWRYVNLAERLSQQGKPRLFLMHGVSGSGKSRLAGELSETLGAVWIRSDIERKRLFGLGPFDASDAVPGGIYTPEAGRHTFEHIEALARGLLADSHNVIVDATFQRKAHRAPFIKIAKDLRCPWRILSLHADPDTLRQRVAARQSRGDDASEAGLAVLERQLSEQVPLDDEERAHGLVFEQSEEAVWPHLIGLLGQTEVR
ncbi:MAG: AAA family ATPase [Hydrogenophilales bacterium]|nr:AAA family ATPase [Hydrogenophilales bacterium]